MLKTKHDIKNHVEFTYSQIREHERPAHDFRIACLYMTIGAYEEAFVYLERYTKANSNMISALKALTFCQQKMNKNPTDHEVIVNFETNSVLNSDGQTTSIEKYLSQVTPRRVHEMTNIKELYEGFGATLSDVLYTTDETNEPDSTSETTNMSETKTLSAILYSASDHNEPDSTSETGQMDNSCRPQKMRKITNISYDDVGSVTCLADECLFAGNQSLIEPILAGGQQVIELESGIDTDIQIEKAEDMLTVKRLECPIVGCSDRFKHKKNIARHINQKHGKRQSDNTYSVNKVVCNICGTVNQNLDNYRQHHELKHNDETRQFEQKAFSVPKPLYKSMSTDM